MLIRSQDKKKIINLNSTMLIRIQNLFGEALDFGILADGMSIGEYSTEEKAIKVLDMICEEYEHFRGDNVYEHSVFNMPQDSEV